MGLQTQRAFPTPIQGPQGGHRHRQLSKLSKVGTTQRKEPEFPGQKGKCHSREKKMGLKEKGKGDEGQAGSNESLVGLRNSPQPAVTRPELDVIPTLREEGKQVPPISQVPSSHEFPEPGYLNKPSKLFTNSKLPLHRLSNCPHLGPRSSSLILPST